MATAEKKYTKDEIINILKSIDIQEYMFEDPTKQKWFRFGAYDALGKACDKFGDGS